MNSEVSRMSATRIRRQVYELTLADLERFPVWEFALDEEGEEGQDEATVRPYAASGALDAAAGMFIVRAKLTLSDGVVQGLCYTVGPGRDWPRHLPASRCSCRWAGLVLVWNRRATARAHIEKLCPPWQG